MEQQASSEWINDRAKDVIDIDDNIPFIANNASTNSSSHVSMVTLNASTTTTTTATVVATTNTNATFAMVDGQFLFESTSLKTETIVLLLMFGICTIIYGSKYIIIISMFKHNKLLFCVRRREEKKKNTSIHIKSLD